MLIKQPTEATAAEKGGGRGRGGIESHLSLRRLSHQEKDNFRKKGKKIEKLGQFGVLPRTLRDGTAKDL